MICRVAVLGVVLASWMGASPGWAKGDASPRTLRSPVRITAGDSDEFLGQLAPDGETVYFVSDRNATTEIFRQSLHVGGPRRLFDDGADVSYPRISPDGKRLLYISYRSDAGGDLCVYALKEGTRACNGSPERAEVQALWFPDSQHIGAMSRAKLHGDLSFRRYAAGAAGEGEVMLPRNLSSPAISPDGGWLASVPVTRTSDRVGVSFSMRSLGNLEFQRLDGKSKPLRLRFDLPGLSGFPVFSRDGEYVYFSQYLNDTNFDGTIDGDDNSVLFRARFDGEKTPPLDVVKVEQLTTARWNCQYPAPAANTLIMTCKRRGSLDIYRLPLDGAVPASWSMEKLEEDLYAARNPWQRLLLLNHMLSRESDETERVQRMREMAHLHLGLGEFESAQFYAKRLISLNGAKGDVLWAEVMSALIEHRREEQRITQGEFNDAFVGDQRKRVVRIRRWKKQDNSPDLGLICDVVESEIFDSIGDVEGARAALENARTVEVGDPVALQLWVERTVSFYGHTTEPSKILSALAVAAQHDALNIHDRIEMGRRFVERVTRGRALSERQSHVAEWLAKVPEASDLAFVLATEQWLLKLAPDVQEKVREGIFEIYRSTRKLPRRQALVEMTVDRAARAGNAYLLYEFSNSWVSYLRRAHSERSHGEDLYKRVVLERAYLEHSEKNYGDARGHFFGVTLQAEVPEAHIGFIENRLLEGKEDLSKTYDKRYRKTPEHPIAHFVAAYRSVRDLRSVADKKARAEVIESALALLQKSVREMPQSAELHHLLGTLYHLRFLDTGNTSAAMDGQAHYLLALDLAWANPRYRAPLVQQLGQLQASVGNHYRAVDRFGEREALPFTSASSELNLLMMKARSLFHSGRADEAADAARRSLGLVEQNKALKRFRPWVLNRLAFFLYVAGKYRESVVTYSRVENIDGGRSFEGNSGGWNRVRHFTMKAAAALAGDETKTAATSLDAAFEALDLLDASSRAPFGSVSLRKRSARHVPRDHRIILLGLRAQLLVRGGDMKGAQGKLLERRTLLEARFDGTERPHDLAEIAHTNYGLAELAWRQKDAEATQLFLEEGIARMDHFVEESGTLLHPTLIELLRGYASLHFYGRIPLDSLALDLRKRLGALYEELCLRNNPKWEAERFVLGIYLSMLRID